MGPRFWVSLDPDEGVIGLPATGEPVTIVPGVARARAVGDGVTMELLGELRECVSVGEFGQRPIHPSAIVAEWRKGCSNTPPHDPSECSACTAAAMRAVARWVDSQTL